MRTKIFLAFIAIIFSALLSNFIFEYLIIKDFESYTESVKEDQYRWVMASIEGNYSESGWDKDMLSESIHWGMMLGLDIKVIDAGGKEIETAFKKRVQFFLYMSLLIVGVGLILMASLFSRSLSRPITDLKTAAERNARGEFDVRTNQYS